MDQSQLAEKLNVPKSTISRIFSGSRELKLGLAREMARELGVTLDYLVDDSLDEPLTDQYVMVTEDEFTLLKLVRRLGMEVALSRLLQVSEPATSSGEPSDLALSYPPSEETRRGRSS